MLLICRRAVLPWEQVIYVKGGLNTVPTTVKVPDRLLLQARRGRRVIMNIVGKFDAHNVSFIVLGTIILWFGWSARSACKLRTGRQSGPDTVVQKVLRQGF